MNLQRSDVCGVSLSQFSHHHGATEIQKCCWVRSGTYWTQLANLNMFICVAWRRRTAVTKTRFPPTLQGATTKSRDLSRDTSTRLAQQWESLPWCYLQVILQTSYSWRTAQSKKPVLFSANPTRCYNQIKGPVLRYVNSTCVAVEMPSLVLSSRPRFRWWLFPVIKVSNICDTVYLVLLAKLCSFAKQSNTSRAMM